MIRVMAVDDQPLVLAGLRAVLDADPDFLMVGTAGSTPEALLLARKESPDVVILEVRGPGEGGFDLIGRLFRASPTTECVVLTTPDDASMTRKALGEGARGCLPRTVSVDDLCRAVRRVASGRTYVDPSASECLVPAHRTVRAASPTVTRREREVLGLAAQGLTNEAIGVRLGVGAETVKTHLSRVFAKVGAKDRANAVAIAMRRGII